MKDAPSDLASIGSEGFVLVTQNRAQFRNPPTDRQILLNSGRTHKIRSRTDAAQPRKQVGGKHKRQEKHTGNPPARLTPVHSRIRRDEAVNCVFRNSKHAQKLPALNFFSLARRTTGRPSASSRISPGPHTRTKQFLLPFAPCEIQLSHPCAPLSGPHKTRNSPEPHPSYPFRDMCHATTQTAVTNITPSAPIGNA